MSGLFGVPPGCWARSGPCGGVGVPVPSEESDVSSPVAMRLQLRVELKRLRVGAGLTQKAVADSLDWSTSKVIRIENGSNAVSVSDLRALAGLYGLTSAD